MDFSQKLNFGEILVFPHHWRLITTSIIFVATKKKKMFVATKHVFCHDKSKLVATKLLSRQIFVAIKILLSRQKTCFVATNTCLSRQKYACRIKTIVGTMFVETIVLSRQALFDETKDVFCRDKHMTKENYTCGSSRQ